MTSTPQGRTLAWTLLALAALVNVAGYAFDLYQLWWWFDRAVHPASIFALTIALALLVFAPAFKAGHPLLTVFLVASVGLAIGALWEVAEWAFDRFTEANSIKGKHDTVLDIILDTVGALAGGFLSLTFLRASNANSRD